MEIILDLKKFFSDMLIDFKSKNKFSEKDIIEKIDQFVEFFSL